MKRYITISKGMAGYFAVLVWWNDEDPKFGFWEPYDTGVGRYQNPQAAIDEAKEWAVSENLRYIGPGESFE